MRAAQIQAISCPKMNAIDAVTPAELSRAAALFGTMKQLRIQLKSADENSLDRAFEAHVHSVLERLDERLPTLMQQNQENQLSENQASQLMSVEVIMARHGLYDAAFQQVVMLCQTIAPGFGDCVRELRATHSALLTDLQHSFCEVANENLALSRELALLQQDSGGMQSDVVALQDTLQALNSENEDYKKRVLELRKNLREATQQIKYLKEAVSVDPKAVAQGVSAVGTNAATTPLSSSMASFNNAYMSNTLNFEDPSAGMSADQQMLMNNSGKWSVQSQEPKRSSSAGRGQRSPADAQGASNNRLRRPGSSGNLNASTPGEWNSSVKDSAIREAFDDASLSNTSAGTSPSRAKNNTLMSAAQKGGLSIVAPVNWLLIFRAEVQKALDEGRCREMTLNEVTETIQKLYQSKVIANEKASRGIGNVPMETMEQHVFRTYETKYGLRGIAVEHAGALLRSLLLHAAADNEVQVFLKIFRNELEEEFRFIQSELFTSIKDLTLVQLMSRFPNKDTAHVNQLLDQKMNGSIYEDEWTDMTSYLYNAADSTTLCVLLKKLATAEKEKVGYFDTGLGVTKAPLSVNSNAKIVKANTSYVLESATGNSSAPTGYDKRSVKDVKRLGYSSPTLQITVKESYNDARKNSLKLPYKMFLRTVLDFQLQSHLQYLHNFVKVFRDIDRDVDGVISAADFKECFLIIRRSNDAASMQAGDDTASVLSTGSSKNGQRLVGAKGKVVRKAEQTVTVVNEVTEAEMAQFLQLIVECDPMQTDRVTFSAAVTCLSKMKPL